MICVLTGDIINSRRSDTKRWLKILRNELSKTGATPKNWEIYRGDSFQAEIKNPAQALHVALKLKAAIKTLKGTDVRIAVGIGDKTYNAKTITESNGSAFVHSGQLAGELKSLKMNLAVRSHNADFNNEINLYLKLLLLIMDNWTVNAAATLHAALEYPDKSQEALGKLLKVKQNAVSTRLKRACYYEVLEVLQMYQTKIKLLQ
ncbi:MAG: transcriptional regulator [Cyclobacteriaceae bacterium]|nr:transcriptional regulator [Cytophagales bacterium]MBX2900449.1 transcriptional regulator [Cyclobacteriaceae bacterium]